MERTPPAEKIYLVNFTGNNKNSYSFVNGAEAYKFKAIDFEIVTIPLCLGNISKSWSVDNMKNTGLNGYFMILVLIIMLLQLMVY